MFEYVEERHGLQDDLLYCLKPPHEKNNHLGMKCQWQQTTCNFDPHVKLVKHLSLSVVSGVFDRILNIML